jgi:hypothetical protein
VPQIFLIYEGEGVLADYYKQLIKGSLSYPETIEYLSRAVSSSLSGYFRYNGERNEIIPPLAQVLRRRGERGFKYLHCRVEGAGAVGRMVKPSRVDKTSRE